MLLLGEIDCIEGIGIVEVYRVAFSFWSSQCFSLDQLRRGGK